MNNLSGIFKKKGWILVAGFLLLAGLCGNICAQEPAPAAGKTISPKKFERLMKKKNSIVLDVRTTAEYKAGHIPGSLQIDVLQAEQFKKEVAALDKNKSYLLYCRSGKRSADAMQLMKAAGFGKLYDLEGGFNGWTGEKELK